MRKYIIVIMITMVWFISPVFLQSQIDYDDFVSEFEAFTDGVATTLPFNSIIGLNWSDAYIGNFPHFGVGITAGVAFMPYGSLEDTLDGLGVDMNAIENEGIKNMLEGLGMPFPAIVLEGRLGGFVLPFDMGFKIGYIPPDFELSFTEGIVIDYLLVGADVRFRVLKGALAIPTVSVGGGLTYQYGSFDMAGMLGGEQEITNIAGGHTISLSDPDLNFNWKAFVVDVKAQASWNVLLLTPFVGAGASYAPYAEAGGGMKSKVYFDGSEITQDDIDMVDDYYNEIDEPAPDLNDGQIIVYATTPAAWSIRAFGGVSVNLALFRIDLLGLFNFASGAFGASLNVRLQL
ncbi:MAG: hypothetical protein JXB88_08835 [Spirochaetales bacterium]|nr:hypothetical protein [Spirochaetales bacterium]